MSEGWLWKPDCGYLINTRLADGRTAVLNDIDVQLAQLGSWFTTYNIEVADYHTYFVGDDGVWVHYSSKKAA